MDYLKPADFRKIKAFFKALNEGRFKVNTNINSATVLVDGIPTPVNKTECLNLLRSFPELSGEEFKNDNFLIKYLQDPLKRKYLLGRLTPQQQIELTQVFEEKPVAVGSLSEQPLEQEQPPVEESPATMAEGGGFPTIAGGGTAAPVSRRVIHIVPKAEKIESELVAANKSGVVAEAPPSKIYIADKSGNIVGERSLTKEGVKTPEQPKLVTANKSGVVAEAPPSKLFIANKGGAVVGERSLVTGARKNFFSSAGRFFKTNFGKFLTPQLLARGVTTAIGGFLGKGIAGNPGMLAGAGLGAIAPDALKSGWLGNKLGSIAKGAVNFFPNLSDTLRSKLAKIPKPSGSFLKGGRAAALGFGIFFFMTLGLALLGGATSGTAAPVGTTPITAVDVSSCKLTRSDQSPKEVNLKSSLLGNYFQEAEKVTTVPAQVLAGIARLENSDFVANADNNHDAFYGRNFTDITQSCAPHFNGTTGKSSTGALGLMQIQPPGTTGHFDYGVNFGASFFGKTVSTLTVEDYCDPRKNILLAAGFTLKKLQRFYNIGDGTKWDPTWTNDKSVIDKVAKGFYGCLKYTSCEDASGSGGGPYSYGDDLWSSVQSCKIITPLYTPGIVPPADPDPVKLRLAIINEFGVNFDTTFSHDYLKWAWEKFWHAKNTKFIELLTDSGKKEIIITRNDKDINRQLGCRTVQMRGKNSAGIPYPEPLFKVVLIHELSHIIEQVNCTPTALSKKGQLQSVINQEGYITRYSANTNICVGGTSELNEDYAEMISYFLNQDLPEQTLGIHPACDPDPSKPVKNPYQDDGKPLHKQLATEILGVTVPTPTPTPSQTSTASCPIPNGNIICPSYGKIASGEVIEDPTCVVSPRANADEADTVGHCGPLYREKYPELCTDDTSIGGNLKPYISGGNLRRTAKSIDIVNQSTVPGQEVFLPNIKGQILKWYYKGVVPAGGDSAGGDYGFIRLFQSEPTADGVWSLHYTHVNANDPILPVGAERRSGQVAATLIKQTDIFEGDDATHLHFTIGLNVGDSTSDLKDYSPGWKFPDRELGMCR